MNLYSYLWKSCILLNAFLLLCSTEGWKAKNCNKHLSYPGLRLFKKMQGCSCLQPDHPLSRGYSYLHCLIKLKSTDQGQKRSDQESNNSLQNLSLLLLHWLSSNTKQILLSRYNPEEEEADIRNPLENLNTSTTHSCQITNLLIPSYPKSFHISFLKERHLL